MEIYVNNMNAVVYYMETHLVVISDGKSSPLSKGHPSIWLGDALHEPACRWLNGEIVPCSESVGTWDTAARSVVTWLDYCLATSVDWRHAFREDLVAYRDAYLAAISPVTGRRYQPSTVRTRMTFILSFLEYAASSGFYCGDIVQGSSPGGSLPRASSDLNILAGTRGGRSRTARRLTPKQTYDDTIRVIRRDELQHLLRWAGPRPCERAENDLSGCDRDYILLALGWAVGLRAAEMLGLKTYPFESIVVDPAYLGEYYKISITGKGCKTRRVDVPAWLIMDIQAYIAGARRGALAQRGRRAREAQLILNGAKAKSRVGKPIGKSGIDVIMRRACNACSLTEISERINPETGEVAMLSRPKYSLHSLRHTYSVMTYHNMASAGFSDYERWKYIQLQLGHASPKTTIDFYLRHASVWANKRAASMLLEVVE